MKFFFLTLFTLSAGAAMNKDYSVSPIKPSLEVSAAAKSEIPEVSVYLRKQQLLAEGKVTEASALTTNAAAFAKTMAAYKERAGEAAFKENMSAVLKDKLMLTHVIRKGSHSLLVGKHPEHGVFGAFLSCENKNCLIEESFEGPAAKSLGTVFQELREEKLKL